MRIRHYFSTMSPFAYLAGPRLARVAEARGVEVDHRPVDVRAIFAEVGAQPVHARHRFRQEYRLQELARWSRALEMPLTPHPAHWPADPAPSSLAILRAKATGRDVGPLIRRTLAGVWAEGRDLADPAVVAEMLAAEGFDRTLAEGDPPGIDAAAEHARLTGEALEDGVFGVPFFVCEDGERFWGQDRVEMLDAHLARIGG